MNYLDGDLVESVKVIRKFDAERFFASQTQGVGSVSSFVLQWYDAHTDKITAMNPFKTLGKHSSHSLLNQQLRITIKFVFKLSSYTHTLHSNRQW